LQEIDYRVKNEYMLLNQMYGSIKDKNSPVSRKALGSIPRPSESKGADAWLSEGGNYGHITYEKVYKLPAALSIEAKLVDSYEEAIRCCYCNRKYLKEDGIDGFCSVYCKNSVK
jgi:hypothetical protein